MPGRTRTRWVVSTSRSGATLSGVRWTPSRRTSTSRVSPGRRLRQKGMRRRSRQSSSGRPGWSRWAPASRFLRRWRLGRHEAELSRSSRATCSRRLSTPRSPGTTASTSTSCRWFARPCAESKAPISRIGSILKGEHSSNESQSCRVAGFDDGLAGEGETMSGHSKWATTKHKKGVIDAKRGKLFAKMIKNIEVAARTGGGDVAGNPTLFDAIQRAKKLSVPNDNINNAVKRGSGATAGGADWQTITYEGYAPNGVAVLIECLTDNRNRAHLGGRTVAVVGQALDQDRDTVGRIALIGDGLPVGAAGRRTAATLDGVVDVVVGDAELLGPLDRIEQGRVAGDVAAPRAGSHLDVLDHLGEKLASLGVDHALLVLGRRPLGVTAHRFSLACQTVIEPCDPATL